MPLIPITVMQVIYFLAFTITFFSSYKVWRMGYKLMAIPLAGLGFGALSLFIFYIMVPLLGITLQTIALSRWMNIVNGIATFGAGSTSYLFFVARHKQ